MTEIVLSYSREFKRWYARTPSLPGFSCSSAECREALDLLLGEAARQDAHVPNPQ